MPAQDDVPIATIAKNKRDQFRVALRTFHGNRGVDVRVYVPNGDGEQVPTAKGIAIKPSLIQPIIDALIKARDTAIDEGLIEPEAGR
jgi:hypothetical protein